MVKKTPTKVCPKCGTVQHVAVRKCKGKGCKHTFTFKSDTPYEPPDDEPEPKELEPEYVPSLEARRLLLAADLLKAYDGSLQDVHSALEIVDIIQEKKA